MLFGKRVSEFRFIFQNIPTLSLDYIRQYLFMVIKFFKSYKVDLIETNNIYIMDDKLENKIMIIDRILYNLTLNKHEHIDVDDFKKFIIKPELHDGIAIDDIIYIVLNKWKRMFPTDYYRLMDRFSNIWIKPTNKDYIFIEDMIDKKHYNYEKHDRIPVIDSIPQRIINIKLKDHMLIDDYIYTS